VVSVWWMSGTFRDLYMSAKTNKSSFENESVGVLLLQARFHKTVFLNDDFVFYLRFFKVNRSVGFNVLLFYYGS
jgi:hypothetical protein